MSPASPPALEENGLVGVHACRLASVHCVGGPHVSASAPIRDFIFSLKHITEAAGHLFWCFPQQRADSQDTLSARPAPGITARALETRLGRTRAALSPISGFGPSQGGTEGRECMALERGSPACWGQMMGSDKPTLGEPAGVRGHCVAGDRGSRLGDGTGDVHMPGTRVCGGHGAEAAEGAEITVGTGTTTLQACHSL